MTTHMQVNVDGVEVDEGLSVLLPALWEAGIRTQFSCQGGPSSAMILFPTVTDGLRFVEETLAVTGYYGCYAGRLTMNITPPDPRNALPWLEASPVRMRVEWPHEFTPVWVAAWNGTPMGLHEVLEIADPGFNATMAALAEVDQ